MEITPPNLTDYQKAILFSKKRFTITEAATKCGKTYSHICWLFGMSMQKQPKQGCNYWWVAPIYGQAEIAYNRLRRYLSGVKGFKFNDTRLTIITPLTSIITFKTADKPDNLYGEDVYGAVFDEFTRSKEISWHALRSTLTATRAPCKLIGNYKGQSNWGHQLSVKAKDKNSDYEYFRVTAWDAVKAGILEEEEVLQAQKDLPMSVFKALYLAEGDESPDRLITDDEIADIFTNDHAEEGETAITADIAMQGSDRFVVMAWKGRKVIDIAVMDKSNGKEVIDAISHFRNKHKVNNSRIVYDADGVGSFVDGFILGAKSFHNGGKPIKVKGQTQDYRNLKAQCYFAMAANIGKYYLLESEYKNDIIQELECVRNRTFGKDGKLEVLKKEEIKELIGRSPDFSDAMMMREYLELSNNHILATDIF